MRKLRIILAAVAMLALPAAASAHSSWWHHDHALFAKLSGTGTSFGGSSATASGQIVAGHVLSSGTFSASLTTDWTQSTTKTGEHGTLVCAPASLSLTLTDSASSANTESSKITGKLCTFTKTDGTVFRGFFGAGSVTGAGPLASLSGHMERALLMQKADATVHGAVFADFHGAVYREVAPRCQLSQHLEGDCCGHHQVDRLP